MEYFFLIIGSITVIITTVIIINDVNDKNKHNNIQKEDETNRKLNILINNVIELGNTNDLMLLSKQQIVLSDEQKLEILLHAYSANNESILSYLRAINYKLSLTKIIALFLNKKDQVLLKFLLINFLDKKLSDDRSHSLKDLIAELFSKNDIEIIALLLEIYPINTLNSLFFLTQQDQNALIFQYIIGRTQWLQKNYFILNKITFGTDLRLINFLLDLFPNGELSIDTLSNIIKQLINHSINSSELYIKLCHQMNKASVKDLQESRARYFINLKELLEYSVQKNRLDVLEFIIQSNLDLLSESTKESDQIIASYTHHNTKISELFFRNGINVNRDMLDKVSIVERSIIDTGKTNDKDQSILDMLLHYGLDLNTKIIKGKPDKINELSLLGYLVFTSLTLSNNPDFNALKLQKFMAMFFDIPGTSYSNGTLCVHEYMRDSNAYWNYILDLYFSDLEPTPLIQDLPSNISITLNRCLKVLYSLNGTYDTKLIYDIYNNNEPIVLPVNLRGFWGELHIATVGFIKINNYYHLRIEADKGLGRNDFSIFVEPIFSIYELSRYTLNRISAIPLEEQWQDGPSTKHHILTIPIGKQKSNSCPSTAAKYAFHIAYFLCEIHNRNFSLTQRRNDQISLLQEIYHISNKWFEKFLVSTQQLLLRHYQELDAKYIDIDFLIEIQKELTIKESDEISSLTISP